MCYRRLGTKTCHRTPGMRGRSPSAVPVSQGTPEPWTSCVTSRFGRAWASGTRRAWVLLLTLLRVSRVAGSSAPQNRSRSLSAALWTSCVTSQRRGPTDLFVTQSDRSRRQVGPVGGFVDLCVTSRIRLGVVRAYSSMGVVRAYSIDGLSAPAERRVKLI